MDLTCPWCGEHGHDREPLPPGRGGPITSRQKVSTRSRFGAYLGAAPVRKCLSCGNGIRVTILPPRFRKVWEDDWEEMERRWAAYQIAEREHFDRV